MTEGFTFSRSRSGFTATWAHGRAGSTIFSATCPPSLKLRRGLAVARDWNPRAEADGTWYDPDMPFDPLRDLRAWQDRLERLAHHHAESWAPPIDVYETPAAYVISVEVPGVTRDQVELAVEDARLTIRGRRLDPPEEKGDTVHYHQIERGHGAFARSFEFAEKVDVDQVSADLADGVLTITLPKLPAAPARRIEVR